MSEAETQPDATEASVKLDRSMLLERPMPDGYRAELRRMEMEAVASRATRGGSLLLFQLGGLRLALPTTIAAAVAPILHIARIPHRSGTVLQGVVAFRGAILPCVSVARLLDLPESAAASSTGRMLILEESPGRSWAILIDGMLGVLHYGAEDTETESPLAAHWVRGSVTHKNGTFHVLDHDVLFRQIAVATA